MLGATWSMAQQNDLLDRQWRLEARITTYDHRISVIIKLDNSTNWSANDGSAADMIPDALEGLSDTYPEGWFTPEQEQIMLPSSLAAGEIKRLSLRPFALIETELWKGQIMDALEGLRLALGEKSLYFKTQVRNANSQQMTCHAWDNVHKLDHRAWTFQPLYPLAWSTLQCLSIDPEYCATLQDITDDYLMVAGDLMDEWRYGQQLDSLPWFWCIGYENNTSSPQMQECTYSSLNKCCPINLCPVYWVSWLRAKVRHSHWVEELWLVELEMGWTLNWFDWKKDQWLRRLDDLEDGASQIGLLLSQASGLMGFPVRTGKTKVFYTCKLVIGRVKICWVWADSVNPPNPTDPSIHQCSA